ncbi:hypothetical protein [Streptomyces scabichelini]|uniref:hypothetical protein n=1 Tax=Streptomyces scabichelini TaxID=2711217 RepID=UPI0019D179BD|nr:hypothetical protein [Streptomyces scabichelini]
MPTAEAAPRSVRSTGTGGGVTAAVARFVCGDTGVVTVDTGGPAWPGTMGRCTPSGPA